MTPQEALDTLEIGCGRYRGGGLYPKEAEALAVLRACVEERDRLLQRPTGRVNLGWANSWRTDSPGDKMEKRCHKELKHPWNEKNLDPSMHGLDHLVWCDICGYEYHYDSSD